jgi:hypothetical protein
MSKTQGKRYWTTDECATEVLTAIDRMTPKQLAEFRIVVRKQCGLPPMPEPDAWEQ